MKRFSTLLICILAFAISGAAQIQYIGFSYTTPPLPVVDAGNDTGTLYGYPITLNGQVTSGTAPYTYLWQPGHLLTDSTIPNPTLDFTDWPFGLGPYVFTFTVTDSNGCVASDQVTVHIAVNSVDEHNMADVRIFPNPAGDVVFIEGLTVNEFDVSCYSLMGQRIARKSYSNQPFQAEFDLSGVSPGVYLLKITAGSSSSVHKLIIR